jgi:hypothetical protein
MTTPDIKPGLSREEWDERCARYAEDAFYTPPEEFLFHHYDDNLVLVARCPMIGIERYVVNGKQGGFYGIYDTRDITYYIKSGTWVVVDDPDYFKQQEIAELEARLAELKKS